MIISSFFQMLPILLAIAGGFLYAHRFDVDATSLVNITTDVLLGLRGALLLAAGKKSVLA